MEMELPPAYCNEDFYVENFELPPPSYNDFIGELQGSEEPPSYPSCGSSLVDDLGRIYDLCYGGRAYTEKTQNVSVNIGNPNHNSSEIHQPLRKTETVEVKLTPNGMYTKDEKIQKMDKLMRFFQQQNSTPKFSIRVWGFHYHGEDEKDKSLFKTRSKSKSLPNLNKLNNEEPKLRAKSAPVLPSVEKKKSTTQLKVIDFSYTIDATEFVDDHGKLLVADEIKTGVPLEKGNNQIKRALQTYLESNASVKEIYLRKKIAGNFSAIRSAIVYILKEVHGYPHNIKVEFIVDKGSVAVKRHTKAAKALNSRPLAFAGIVSIIGAAALPLAKKAFLKKCIVALDSEFSLKISPLELVSAIEDQLHI